jgi:imidazolonepropionase-like amidohydrolase
VKRVPIAVLGLVPASCAVARGQARAPAAAPVKVIRAARMFDGRSETTIGNAVVVIEGIRDGLVPGPRMLVARYAPGATGGHCDRTGFPPGKFGAEPGLEKGIFQGANEGRQAVRLDVKYGADDIKMCASGGVLSFGDDVSVPQLTDEELAAVVDEAHRLGRRMAAHAHGDLAAQAAVLAGIDSICPRRPPSAPRARPRPRFWAFRAKSVRSKAVRRRTSWRGPGIPWRTSA